MIYGVETHEINHHAWIGEVACRRLGYNSDSPWVSTTS